jgi:hypothetical protein
MRWRAWFQLSWRKTVEILKPYIKEVETDG